MHVLGGSTRPPGTPRSVLRLRLPPEEAWLKLPDLAARDQLEAALQKGQRQHRTNVRRETLAGRASVIAGGRAVAVPRLACRGVACGSGGDGGGGGDDDDDDGPPEQSSAVDALAARLREARLRAQVWQQGSLDKLNRRGVWQSRFFIMRGRELVYFASRRDFQQQRAPGFSVPLHSIVEAVVLDDASQPGGIDTGGGGGGGGGEGTASLGVELCTFEVRCAETEGGRQPARTLTLSAASAEAAAEWCRAIHAGRDWCTHATTTSAVTRLAFDDAREQARKRALLPSLPQTPRGNRSSTYASPGRDSASTARDSIPSNRDTSGRYSTAAGGRFSTADRRSAAANRNSAASPASRSRWGTADRGGAATERASTGDDTEMDEPTMLSVAEEASADNGAGVMAPCSAAGSAPAAAPGAGGAQQRFSLALGRVREA